jgi:hypothetical protein
MLGIDSWSPKRSTNTGSGVKKKKGNLGGKTEEKEMWRKEEECREKIKEEKKTERGERGQKGMADEGGMKKEVE